MKEATARIKINRLLGATGWRFFDDGHGAANIRLESGATIKQTDLDALGNGFERTSKIPLPPLDVQNEIVAEIEGYQKDIGHLKAEIANQEKNIQRSIARVWGVGEPKTGET